MHNHKIFKKAQFNFSDFWKLLLGWLATHLFESYNGLNRTQNGLCWRLIKP